MLTKTCTSCGIEKPVSEYHAAKRARGERTPRNGFGVMAQCKVCRAEARRPGIMAQREEAKRLAASGLKVCNVCDDTKPLDAFNKRKASPDGKCLTCRECAAARLAEWRAANPDSYKDWYRERADERREYSRKWAEENREGRAAYHSRYSQENRDIINAKNAKRIAMKLRATVPWADHEKIRAIYAEAARLTRETGIKHEVDHIYPLQGKNGCGLHVETNLQILTKTENIRKRNRMPEELGYA